MWFAYSVFKGRSACKAVLIRSLVFCAAGGAYSGWIERFFRYAAALTLLFSRWIPCAAPAAQPALTQGGTRQRCRNLLRCLVAEDDNKQADPSQPEAPPETVWLPAVFADAAGRIAEKQSINQIDNDAYQHIIHHLCIHYISLSLSKQRCECNNICLRIQRKIYRLFIFGLYILHPAEV